MNKLHVLNLNILSLRKIPEEAFKMKSECPWTIFLTLLLLQICVSVINFIVFGSSVVVSSSSSKRTIPSEKVKKNTRQKEATKRKRVISKKQTGEEEDNAV